MAMVIRLGSGVVRAAAKDPLSTSPPQPPSKTDIHTETGPASLPINEALAETKPQRQNRAFAPSAGDA